MIYTKYRKTEINYAIIEESGNQGSWKGPLVVMRLDAVSATRLVSITSKTHKDLAIQAVAKYASSRTIPYSRGSPIGKVHKHYEYQNFYPAVQNGPVAPEVAGDGRLNMPSALLDTKRPYILPTPYSLLDGYLQH